MAETRAALAERLSWPDNLGVEFRSVGTGTQDLLVLFLAGMADAVQMQQLIMQPLESLLQRQRAGGLTPDRVAGALLSVGTCVVRTLTEVAEGVANGATALCFGGEEQALLIMPPEPPGAAVKMPGAGREVFGSDLHSNVAQLRRRLRTPSLIARPVATVGGRSVRVVVFLAGRAVPELVSRVTGWAAAHGTEDALRQGRGTSRWIRPGLLPRLLSSTCPDQTSVLLDAGYVALLSDRVPFAFIAPVTAEAILRAPGDDMLRRPIGGLLRAGRVVLATIVVQAPAIVVAVEGYHHEMLPTTFMLTLAARREIAAFPVIAEVAALMLIQELLREAMVRLPAPISPGAGLIAGCVIVLLLAHVGFVGPLVAVTSVLTGAAALGLPGYDAVTVARAWAWPAVLGAAVFGLLGLSAVTFLLTAYLSQSVSFGVPFLGHMSAGSNAGSRRPPARKQEAGFHG